jgi:hypothetical protein
MQAQEQNLNISKRWNKVQPWEIEEGFEWLNLLSLRVETLGAKINPCM